MRLNVHTLPPVAVARTHRISLLPFMAIVGVALTAACTLDEEPVLEESFLDPGPQESCLNETSPGWEMREGSCFVCAYGGLTILERGDWKYGLFDDAWWEGTMFSCSDPAGTYVLCTSDELTGIWKHEEPQETIVAPVCDESHEEHAVLYSFDDVDSNDTWQGHSAEPIVWCPGSIL